VRLLLVPLLALAAALLAACGDTGEGGEVNVTLREWAIETDKDSLPEGPVELTIENDGEEDHELVIVKTDIPPEDLPILDDGSFDEDAPDVDVEQEVEDVESGDRTGRTYELDPGAYVFLCNLVEDIEGTETSHFDRGMRAAFTVTEDE
jgi:hypothetical protein